MDYCYVLLIFATVITLSRGYKSELNHTSLRSLATGSNYLSCQQCNEESDGNYLNATCTDFVLSRLPYYNFTIETEYPYGNGLSETAKNLMISDNDYSIDLFASNETSSTFHPLGEWKILFLLNYEVNIDIERNPSNYEEFYAYISGKEIRDHYFSKNFANGEQANHRITFENTGFIKFRALKLNDSSNYKVTMSQPYSRNRKWIIALLIVSSIVLMASVTILVMTFVWLLKSIREARARNYTFVAPDQNKK